MAKRSLGITSPVVPGVERQVPRRTERSHEENQERAYIAASRRADRSLEARVQSARMASEIHKKRTGKGFKITEEIVMREEMYEEEEDDLPRHYRVNFPHLQTQSPDMNNRLNAYVTNQVAIANIARQQEVDRIFAEQFPGVAQAAQYQQQQQHHLYSGRPPPPHMAHLQNFNHVGLGSGSPHPRERTHSMPDVTPMSPLSSYHHNSFQNYNYTHNHNHNHGHLPSSTRHTSIDGQMSPGASPTPGSTISRTISTPITNYSAEDISSPAKQQDGSGIPVDPSLTMSAFPGESTDSSFTSRLPTETRMMVGDINDEIVSAMYGGELMGELMGSDQYFGDSQHSITYGITSTFSQTPSTHDACTLPHGLTFEYPEPHSQPAHAGNSTSTQESRSGTPNTSNVDWEQWIN